MNLRQFIRRIIVRAAPTCTLWSRPDLRTDVLRFRFWPRWNITGLEVAEAGGPLWISADKRRAVEWERGRQARLDAWERELFRRETGIRRVENLFGRAASGKPRFDAASPPISELPQRASASSLAVVKLKG